jgi:adenylate kinase
VRLLIFGPQGAGKGTQAALLAPHWGIPHISTGDIFRANVASRTPMGVQVAAALAAGELAPDYITQNMLAARLLEPDARGGFVLDGFPRTPEQAEWLDAQVEGEGLDAVILLTVPDEELLHRALQRGRHDDTAETISRRLAIYHETTEPLLRFYGPLVISIDGNRPVPVVHQEIIAAVANVTASV